SSDLTGEAQEPGDDRNDQEDQRPAQHGALLAIVHAADDDGGQQRQHAHRHHRRQWILTHRARCDPGLPARPTGERRPSIPNAGHQFPGVAVALFGKLLHLLRQPGKLVAQRGDLLLKLILDIGRRIDRRRPESCRGALPTGPNRLERLYRIADLGLDLVGHGTLLWWRLEFDVTHNAPAPKRWRRHERARSLAGGPAPRSNALTISQRSVSGSVRGEFPARKRDYWPQ